jgi:hypothetical protein
MLQTHDSANPFDPCALIALANTHSAPALVIPIFFKFSVVKFVDNRGLASAQG